jgi:hypothetical protein
MITCVLRCSLIVALGIFILAGACGTYGGGKPAGGIGVPAIHRARWASYDFSSHFRYDPLQVSPDAPQYGLPVDQGSITDFDRISSRLELSADAQRLLLTNGFVVTDFRLIARCEEVGSAYEVLKSEELPVLVTSGSLLHTYHVLFDDILRSIESEHFYDDIWMLASNLLTNSMDTYTRSSGDLKEASMRNAAFMAVGLSLLEPKEDQVSDPDDRLRGPATPGEFVRGDLDRYAFDMPDEIRSTVEAELDLIAAHAGFAESPIFIYGDDYSQYVPRGHYTATEKLKNYFRAMMWFGRMTMLLKGAEEIAPGATCRTCDALVSTYDARIQTLAASLIAAHMGRNPDLLERWEKIYEVTSFFVGFSDDLGPYEYLGAMNDVLGSGFDLARFNEKSHAGLKARLAEERSPLIYGGTGDCMILPPFTPEQADECIDKARGFRLMGQRFVPDSYVLSKMVAPHVGALSGENMPFTAYTVPGVGTARVFPRGLDFMAIMGSRRALEILDATGDSHYAGFERAFADLRAEMEAIPDEDWNQNLYWNWLWVLRALLSEAGAGRPTFMQVDPWQDRVLAQALASWSELRHDTILYVKQSYTVALGMVAPRPEPHRPLGYVEPVPEVYNRLRSLTGMMRSGLKQMEVLEPAYERRLQRLEEHLSRLLGIATKEIEGTGLTSEEHKYISDFADVIDDVLGGLEARSRKTTVIADVHTDANSGQVLEEGSGYIGLTVVVWTDGDAVYLAAGPEMTYYEFKQPMTERLTDKAWREMLARGEPDPPGWTQSYAAP